MPEPNFQFLVRKNLLYTVEAAVDTQIFRHTYVLDKRDNREIDTMSNGDLSCAYFVSGMLTLLMLIDHPHSTVPTTLTKMEEAGWYKIDTPQPGAVVHWPVGKTGHEHIGFYVGENQFISNSYKTGAPKRHGSHWRTREPDAYYWHPKLDDNA